MKKVIIAGGGTGGHIFPAIAIANALKAQDPEIDILFVGAKGKMEMEKVPQAGYPIEGLDIAGLNRSNMLKNLSLPFKLIESFIEVKRIFKSFQPDVAIGVGGYSTFPVLKYAQKYHIPTFIHESNSFAGKSNILLGKNATKIFVAFEGMQKFFPKDRIMITGNPVRENIAHSTISKADAVRSFGLNPNKKTVLVIGGSLGARSINEAIMRHLVDFATLELQLIWQTGKVNASEYISKKMTASGLWVDTFIQDMDKAYAAADVIVSRAGAMSVTEICTVQKPSVLVPYPFAAEDHQTVNANYLVHKNAAVLVDDKDVQVELFRVLTNLVFDDQKMAEMHHNLLPLAKKDANRVIATEILNSL